MINIFKEWRSELCPYCFERFKLRETPFRCVNSRCKDEKDRVLESKWGDSRPCGKVLNSKHFVNSIRCACGELSRKRLCPNCHAELPYGMGDFKNCVFAVIGAKEAGKSHYLAVLIQRLKERVAANLDMSVEAVSSETMNRYERDFYNPVFEERKVIHATRSGGSEHPKPLIYRLTSTKQKKSAVLVFFDTAGENLNDEDLMSRVNKYIYRSSGVLLLVDPLQLPKVRDSLGVAGLPERNTETENIITRTTWLIQKGLDLKPEAPIKIPLAVAFSKFDAVGKLVRDVYGQPQLDHTPNHHGGFDVGDFQVVNEEMKGLLEKWGEGALVNQVKQRYKRCGFFGLSALGCNPQSTKQIDSVLPRRVEDPFLWLLAENGLIKKVNK